MARTRKKRKGTFSGIRLPVADTYVHLVSRAPLLLIGGAAALLVLLFFVVNTVAMGGSAVSNGPLSSAHASFGADCASCHTAFDEVSDSKCAVCHEKYGDELGAFSFSSHYLYHSTDFSRVVPSPEEVSCATCHTEHTGRDANITAVPDTYCATCHDSTPSFEDHPAFMPAAATGTAPMRAGAGRSGSGAGDSAEADGRALLLEDSNLTFSHTQHVIEVRKAADIADIQETCLTCHRAEETGASFKPISFDEACASCHISASESTDWLDVVSLSDTDTPGVVTLQALRSARPPGTQWTDFMSTEEFQSRGDQVRKRPIYHADPWILWNLNRLRSELYGESELTSLLRASDDVPPEKARVLYEEALKTLESWEDELRATPGRDVQSALEDIDDLVGLVQARLRDPYAPLDETRFMVGPASIDPDLSEERVAEYRDAIDRLTANCQSCHRVENAAIARVDADQQAYTRAEFDHRAHYIQRTCLDCHSDIPIRRYAARDSVASAEIDRAEILNLPPIETCQSCHAPARAADNCVTCHLFHPEKSLHANLLRYIE
jgi:hypothetical protein